MSLANLINNRRPMVINLGSGLRLSCHHLDIVGTKSRRCAKGDFHPSEEAAVAAFIAFAEGRPLGKAVPIFTVDLGSDKIPMVLYAYTRRYSAPAPPAPIEIMLEEIQPRDELTYVAIDEKTKFTDSDYQRLLARLRAKESTP